MITRTMQSCEFASVTTIDQLPSVVATDAVEQLVRDFFGAHKDATLRTYRQALDDFRQFVGVEGIDQAASVVLSRGAGPCESTGPSVPQRSGRTSTVEGDDQLEIGCTSVPRAASARYWTRALVARSPEPSSSELL